MSHIITLIPGDGIGPEVTAAVVRIFKAAAVDVEWERHDAGVNAFKRYNQSLPVALLDSIRTEQGRAEGAGDDADRGRLHERQRRAAQGARSLREPPAGPQSAGRGEPLHRTSTSIIVRENTEDLYAGLEHQIVPGVVESLKIITEKASTRIARFAFEYARANGPQARSPPSTRPTS